MRAFIAILTTFVGVVTWATARSVRRYEADLAVGVGLRATATGERVARVEQSRLNHPSQRGNK